VAVPVHQRLQRVEVEHQQRHRPAAAEQLGEHAVEVPRVPETRQIVRQRRLLGLPVEGGILDRDRGVVGEALHEA